jgi:hypothetical protein
MKTKPRNTLNKAIAAAPTHAQKWQRAIEGNTPATAIDKLVSSAASYWKPAPRTAQWEAECKEAYVEARNAIGKPLTPAEMATPADKQFWSAKAWGEWDTQCQAQLKEEFADLLFPALVAGDAAPFKQLVKAMSEFRKLPGLEAWHRRQREKPSKKEKGLRQRRVLLTLCPWEFISLHTLKDAIAREFPDTDPDETLFASDAAIYELMAELHLRLLQPGNEVRWFREGKCVRRLRIMPSGKPKEWGKPLKYVDGLPYSINFPHGMKPA